MSATAARVSPDCAFLLSVLDDGEEHELSEIIRSSQAQRGHGLTVHSRAAELRSRGFVVLQRSERAGNGRTLSFYRLAASAQPERLSSRGADPSASFGTDGLGCSGGADAGEHTDSASVVQAEAEQLSLMGAAA